MSKKKKASIPTRLHPELRQQGLLYRAGYGGICGLDWDSQGLWIFCRGAVLLWDAPEGPLLRRLWTPVQGFAKDSVGRLYTAAQNLDCWDNQLAHLRTFSGHKGRVEDVSVSPDGSLLVSLGEDQQLLVSDPEGQILRQITVAAGSRRLQVDWTRRQARVAGDEASELWDLGSGVRLADKDPDVGPATEPAESPLEEPEIARVSDPSGRWVALASERELLVLEEGEIYRSWDDFLEWPLSMVISPDQRSLVTGGVDGSLSLRRLDSGELLQREPAHADAITSLTTTPGAVISGAADGTICCWEWPGLKLLAQLDGHDGPVQQLLVDGELLFSGGADGQILVWAWRQQTPMAALTGYEASVEELQLAGGGELLLALYDDGSCCTWDVSRFR